MSDISLAWSMSSSGIEGGVVDDAIRVVEVVDGVIVVVDVDGVVASVVGPNICSRSLETTPAIL